MPDAADNQPNDAFLIVVDGDVIARHVLVEYLRDCGYQVIAAASTEEAFTVIGNGDYPVSALLCALPAVGSQSGFQLAQWVREQHPGIDIVLAGTLDAAAEAAFDFCEDKPRLTRPYDPPAIVARIRLMREQRRQALASE